MCCESASLCVWNSFRFVTGRTRTGGSVKGKGRSAGAKGIQLQRKCGKGFFRLDGAEGIEDSQFPSWQKVVHEVRFWHSFAFERFFSLFPLALEC